MCQAGRGGGSTGGSHPTGARECPVTGGLRGVHGAGPWMGPCRGWARSSFGGLPRGPAPPRQQQEVRPDFGPSGGTGGGGRSLSRLPWVRHPPAAPGGSPVADTGLSSGHGPSWAGEFPACRRALLRQRSCLPLARVSPHFGGEPRLFHISLPIQAVPWEFGLKSHQVPVYFSPVCASKAGAEELRLRPLFGKDIYSCLAQGVGICHGCLHPPHPAAASFSCVLPRSGGQGLAPIQPWPWGQLWGSLCDAQGSLVRL